MIIARRPPGRSLRFVLAAVLATGMSAAGALAAMTPAAAAAPAACTSQPGSQPPNAGLSDALNSVAVISPCNAWAVGDFDTDTGFETLIEHWNGTRWRIVPSPNVSDFNFLSGVAAVSARSVWAVGDDVAGGVNQTLIEHWDGTSWKVVPSPDPGGTARNNSLKGVTAVPGGVWAVGVYDNGTAERALAIRWNGTAWKRVRTPNASAGENILVGVVALSSRAAWAVGSFRAGTATQTLIEHWNGTAWKRVPSPNPPSADNELIGVTAVSGNNAWAVGIHYLGTVERTLIEHWNGTRWRHVASPNANAGVNQLVGIAASSAGDAWAVGSFVRGGSTFQTLIEHWNGTAWRRVRSPNVGTLNNELAGVAASSARNIWAVGLFYDGSTDRALAQHCCG